MTATEVRAAGLMFLADVQRDGYDVTPALLAIFPNIDPSVYRLHWEKLGELITEEHDLRNARWDECHPALQRLPVSLRGERADQLADEVRAVAKDQAQNCVVVATRHAMARHMAGDAA